MPEFLFFFCVCVIDVRLMVRNINACHYNNFKQNWSKIKKIKTDSTESVLYAVTSSLSQSQLQSIYDIVMHHNMLTKLPMPSPIYKLLL